MQKTVIVILSYSSHESKTILGNEGWKSSGKYREEFLSMEEIFSVQTPRGTEREGGWGQEKEAVPAGTRNWGHRDGPWAQAAHQEHGVGRKRSILQEEEEGLLSRLSDLASRVRVPPVGAVGVWKAVGGRGTRETGEVAQGPDAAGGCLADIQCQCGHIFWIYTCSLSWL